MRTKIEVMSGFARLAMINLDAADPAAQARFYAAVLEGWDVVHAEGDYAMIGDGTTSIGFGRVPGYEGPGWPDEKAPKRYHLDFFVEDLDKAEEQAIASGATKPAAQPQPDRWRVLLDPSGHPFDICLKS